MQTLCRVLCNSHLSNTAHDNYWRMRKALVRLVLILEAVIGCKAGHDFIRGYFDSVIWLLQHTLGI